MWRGPSGFWGYVKDDTHSVGSVTGVIMAWLTISCRSFSIASLHSVGTFLLACCTGGTEGSRQIVYTPGMLPVVSNDWGDVFFLRKLCVRHLLQKYGLEMNCFQWDFEWENGLGREHYGPVMMENGPVMIVPVVKDGKHCCWW